MMYVILIVVGLAAGLLSGSVGCRRWSDWPCQRPSGYLRAAQQCCIPDTGTCSCQLYCIGSDNGCGIGCAMILGNFIAMRFIRNVN